MEMEFQEIKKTKKRAIPKIASNRTKRSAIWHQTTQNEKNLSKLKGAKYRAARQMALVKNIIKIYYVEVLGSRSIALCNSLDKWIIEAFLPIFRK